MAPYPLPIALRLATLPPDVVAGVSGRMYGATSHVVLRGAAWCAAVERIFADEGYERSSFGRVWRKTLWRDGGP